MNSVEAYRGFVTFIILACIVGLSVLGFGLVNKSSNTETKAKLLHSEPKEISVEVLDFNQVKLTWHTENPTITKIKYSETNLSNNSETIVGTEGEHVVHEIHLKNLRIGSSYEYKIIQDGKEFPDNNEVYSFVIPQNDSSHNIVAPFISEPNPDQSLSIEESVTTPTEGQKMEGTDINTKEDDNEGFSEIIEAQPGQSLGVQTNIIGESITKEFKEALLYQDLRYDFNSDIIIDTKDYPLFINFIMNQED